MNAWDFVGVAGGVCGFVSMGLQLIAHRKRHRHRLALSCHRNTAGRVAAIAVNNGIKPVSIWRVFIVYGERRYIRLFPLKHRLGLHASDRMQEVQSYPHTHTSFRYSGIGDMHSVRHEMPYLSEGGSTSVWEEWASYLLRVEDAEWIQHTKGSIWLRAIVQSATGQFYYSPPVDLLTKEQAIEHLNKMAEGKRKQEAQEEAARQAREVRQASKKR